MTRILRVACIICAAFGFIWMWWILRGLTNIETSVPLVLLGVGIYVSTFASLRQTWHYIILWSVAVLCSLYMFLLIGASIHSPSELRNIPLWMQTINPYVYAIGPFLIVWGVRSVVPVYWRKEK